MEQQKRPGGSLRRASGVPSGDLDRARAAYDGRRWEDAYESFTRIDATNPLGAEDLERLAWAAALTGRDPDRAPVMERLYELHLGAGAGLAAGRAAFWLGFRMLSLGELGRATAWLRRAERLVDEHGGDCVEQGYLKLPEAQRLFGSDDPDAACGMARQAAAIGERFHDPNLTAFARTIEGRALVKLGRHDDGLAVLDEAMLTASTGVLSPLITGIVYCSVIDCCQNLYAVDRAREWTAALAQWCDAQPQLGAFNGTCRVHRSEIMQLQGQWCDAIEEARRASEHFSGVAATEAAAAAFYQQAEIHRLRGDLAAAEEAYRNASQLGFTPQPGLALLRLAQGQASAAAAAIRTMLASTVDPLERTRHLPAAVEILLAAGEIDEARAAADELERIAGSTRNNVLDALAAHARGAIRLADGDAKGALVPLRSAFATWQQVGAPYLAARLRVMIARACHEIGDCEARDLELEACREVFRELGAAPDLARIDRLYADSATARPFGLTPRELEVLRLVASGKTNKAIASALFVSEKTVDRHVSNLFQKLDVSSRAAATAFAYRHRLV